MSFNSSAPEEQQQQLPEIFRRLGKTVPPRDKRSYSGSQPPQDSGFGFVRPFQAKQHYPPPNDLHHANYNNMAIQASISPPPLYYRPQMNNEINTMGFYNTAFSPNDNNNNTMNLNNKHPHHSPASSSTATDTTATTTTTASTATPPPSSSSSLPPQHGFSFIPKDAHPNPNPIISFVRHPNAGSMPSTTYSAPYQFFSNGNINQQSVNNGQQVLHTSPSPVPTSAPVSNVATASASASAASPASPPVSRTTSTGISAVLPSSSNAKKESTGSSRSPSPSSSSDKKVFSSSTPSSHKSEQKKPSRHVSNGHPGSSDQDQETAPIHQRDILAKSIKIIASRSLGSTDKTSSRKHTRHSDNEASDGSDQEIVVNRKLVVASDDMGLDVQGSGRDSSPIRKKTRRLISPTIPKRRRSLSDTSDDDDDSRITKSRHTFRSPSPMSEDRRSRSRSNVSRRRSTSRSRSRSRTRSTSPSKQTRQHRRSESSTMQGRDHSPGLSSDEELAPFLRGQLDRYIPDYNRRPLPPQWRNRSPPAKKPSSSTTKNNVTKISSSSSSPPLPLSKKFTPIDFNMPINSRLNQNKPKDLISYPPLGTLPISFNSPGSRPEVESLSTSKQSTVKKSNPVISHKIVTKPSPTNAVKTKNSSAAVSPALNTKKSASPAAKAAQSSPRSNSIKPNSASNTYNDTNLMPIKQEITTEAIAKQQPKPVVAKSKEVSNTNAITGIETPSQPSTCSMSLDGSLSAARAGQSHASPDTSSKKSSADHAPKVTATAETATPYQQSKRRVFSDSPIANAAEANTNAAVSSAATFSTKPLINGTPTAIPIINTAATTTLIPTVNGSPQPFKRITITAEARAAIRERAAREQERLDQERLRQLDIDDRDDIVMDIAFPTSQSRSPAVKIANKDPVINALETPIQTTTATADSTNNHSIMTSSPKHNNGNATTNDEQVIPVVNHPTSVLNMTSPENVPSPDTTTTVGTNSAFTNLVTSCDNMSVPGGSTTDQTNSMALQTIPPASSSASILESPIAHVSVAIAAAAVTKPVAKKSSRRRLPTPWKVKMNDSGDIYYHNPVTGEETFVRPE